MHTDVYSSRAPHSTPLSGIAGKRVHLIGIGGSGMSGAAAMLLGMGARVSGSDAITFAGMGELVARGATVTIGHHESQLPPDTSLVVMSAAIPPTNPELVAARKFAIPIIKYAECLGALSSFRRGVAIAGTHGKSTTTALTAFILRECGLDPSFVMGARSSQLEGSSGLGGGPHFVLEACEFDRSFLHCRPYSAAILNIESDHLDCFHDFEEIVGAFSQFAGQVHDEGLLVCNADDAGAMKASEASVAAMETFGLEDGADWQAVNLRLDRGCFSFEAHYRGVAVLQTALSIPGRHNVCNALAAIALAHHAGAHPKLIAEAVSRFQGVERRLSYRGEVLGVSVVDDYAHHPTEIRVTLEAARAIDTNHGGYGSFSSPTNASGRGGS